MTATHSTQKGGTRGIHREPSRMKPAIWSLLGRLHASPGVLPPSIPLTRQRKTMRVTVKSLVRYVPTSSLTGDKPEEISEGGKGSNSTLMKKGQMLPLQARARAYAHDRVVPL